MGAIPQGESDYATQIAIGASGGIPVNGNATIGLSAVLVRAANPKCKSRMFVNNGPGLVYPGGNAVTTSNSVPLQMGQALILDRSNGDLYFVASIAGTDLRFLEEHNTP